MKEEPDQDAFTLTNIRRADPDKGAWPRAGTPLYPEALTATRCLLALVR